MNTNKGNLIDYYTPEIEQQYKEFAGLFRTLLDSFVKSCGIKCQSFGRAKAKDKLSEKIDRKRNSGREYATLDEIEDLAGVRLVFYLESDLKKFVELFQVEFKSSIKDREYKLDLKGYRGIHFIIKLDEQRSVRGSRPRLPRVSLQRERGRG